MPAAATSRREFSQRDLIALYTEIYDNISSDAGSSRRPCRAPASRRVARRCSSVRDEVDERRRRAARRPWDIYGYSKEIALKNIAPGRYALRVEAQVRGNNDAKPVVRETLITVVP